MATKTWAQQRAEQITKDLRSKYGRGFDLLSDAQRDALIAESVLMLVLGQFDEKFSPAQDMARTVLAELHTGFKPD